MIDQAIVPILVLLVVNTNRENANKKAYVTIDSFKH